MDTFDVVVIGAGPGGYVAAIRAAQLGLSVAIIDKEWLGGVCLNIGCIPSKALLKNAEVAHLLRERGKDFGFSIENLQLDFAAAVKRSRQVSDRLTRGVGFLMKKHNITVVIGNARLKSTKVVEVTIPDGTTRELTGENIIIATGAHPTTIPGITIDGQKVITYREAILQDHLPASVIIIGAGAIGLEFATVWSAFGSQVTIVEMMPAVAPMEDAEVSAELAKAFTKRGVKIFVDTKVKSVETTNTGVRFLYLFVLSSGRPCSASTLRGFILAFFVAVCFISLELLFLFSLTDLLTYLCSVLLPIPSASLFFQ